MTRHNKCLVIQWRFCLGYGFPTPNVSWKHNLQPLLENKNIRITYDTIVLASRYVTDSAVGSGIVVVDKCYRKGQINDVCVPNDNGIGRQEREKVVKYKSLKKNDIADTYNLQPVDIIPAVIGTKGVMKTNFQKYLQLMPGKVRSLELQIEVIGRQFLCRLGPWDVGQPPKSVMTGG